MRKVLVLIMTLLAICVGQGKPFPNDTTRAKEYLSSVKGDLLNCSNNMKSYTAKTYGGAGLTLLGVAISGPVGTGLIIAGGVVALTSHYNIWQAGKSMEQAAEKVYRYDAWQADTTKNFTKMVNN